jgi:hypothetical protein
MPADGGSEEEELGVRLTPRAKFVGSSEFFGGTTIEVFQS